MKKKGACILCSLLLAVSLAACGGNAREGTEEKSGLSPESTGEIQANTAGSAEASEAAEKSEQGIAEMVSDLSADGEMSQASLAGGDSFEGRDDIAYVLIYNPDLWDQANTDSYGYDMNSTLSTGDLGSQIDITAKRAGGLEEESPFAFIAQPGFGALPEGADMNAESGRAGDMQPVYEEGDTHDFYIGAETRSLETMECLYAGEYCYIWALDGSITEEQAQRYGDEFDTVIYPADVETFGTARFTDEGGKVNILYYDMEEPEGVLGFFVSNDLFASDEISEEQAAAAGLNTDHAIINVNSLVCLDEYEDVVFSTQAHEFQHLICRTDMFEGYYNSNGETIGMADTWINEAMSGYIEEKLYPGVKDMEGHYESFAGSDMIRYGQSMYNFANGYGDIGVYGSVFLFSQYLEEKAGDDVFHNFHDYYRSGDNTDLSTAAALYGSMPAGLIKEIDNNYAYPAELTFANKDQEWVSKMVLDFYMSLLTLDPEDPEAYEKVDAQTLLYDQYNPADIQGGGRVIAATADGTFSIPEDADYGLIYIGLDSNFKPVTGICYE